MSIGFTQSVIDWWAPAVVVALLAAYRLFVRPRYVRARAAIELGHLRGRLQLGIITGELDPTAEEFNLLLELLQFDVDEIARVDWLRAIKEINAMAPGERERQFEEAVEFVIKVGRAYARQSPYAPLLKAAMRHVGRAVRSLPWYWPVTIWFVASALPTLARRRSPGRAVLHGPETFSLRRVAAAMP